MTEFVAKPYSVNTIYERICSVIENPRPFVKSEEFFGPDRRRQEKDYKKDERREKDSFVEGSLKQDEDRSEQDQEDEGTTASEQDQDKDNGSTGAPEQDEE